MNTTFNLPSPTSPPDIVSSGTKIGQHAFQISRSIHPLASPIVAPPFPSFSTVADSVKPAVSRTSSGSSSSDGSAAPKKRAPRKGRSKWTKEEDSALLTVMEKEGATSDPLHCKWPLIAKLLNTGRTGKQCRDRWYNYLRPGIKKGDWSVEEEILISDMYHAFGPKWSSMAKLFTNRTDNDIKNKWYSMMRQKQRGTDTSFRHAAAQSLAQMANPLDRDYEPKNRSSQPMEEITSALNEGVQGQDVIFDGKPTAI